MTKTGIKPLPSKRADVLAAMLDGGGISFEFSGALFTIRQPTTEEYDDALAVEEIARQSVLNSDAIVDLKGKPGALSSMLADDIEAEAESEPSLPQKRKLLDKAERLRKNDGAQEIANQRAHLARDRWLAARLLCDSEGVQLVDPDTADGIVAWERLPMGLKNTARPYIWQMLEAINTLPFGWALPPKSSTGSVSVTDAGPSLPESSD